MKFPSTSKMLTSPETATFLGLQPTTLEIWRTRGKGPKFIKLGNSKQSPIRYLESEVIAWLESRVRSNTSQYPNCSSASTVESTTQKTNSEV